MAAYYRIAIIAAVIGLTLLFSVEFGWTETICVIIGSAFLLFAVYVMLGATIHIFKRKRSK